ncbi:MAG: flagellar motor switch protein FliN [Thioalkalivibrio sp.]|nr:MAG: flagellar motor switch protein FliN [Thioalkalivibrio sp.]
MSDDTKRDVGQEPPAAASGSRRGPEERHAGHAEAPDSGRESVEKASFEPLSDEPESSAPGSSAKGSSAKGSSGDESMTWGERDDVNLEVVLDIPVTLSAEIGRTRIAIRNLLQLNQGSIVELDRLAGEPLDVFVNGTLIAHGEVVVVNEKFGIRLTDVISPAERVKKLK